MSTSVSSIFNRCEAVASSTVDDENEDVSLWSLRQLNDELETLLHAANSGLPFDEHKLDVIIQCRKNNSEFQEIMKEENKKWLDDSHDFFSYCLNTQRGYIPPDIFTMSQETLSSMIGSPNLARRILHKQCLWLVRVSKEDIAKMHESDLLGRYNTEAQSLDIIELCSIFVSLPDSFANDESSRKAAWRDRMQEALQQQMRDMENKTLPQALLRNKAYFNTKPTIDDIYTLHAMEVYVSPKPTNGKPRRSFTEVCRNHSILSRSRRQSDAPRHEEYHTKDEKTSPREHKSPKIKNHKMRLASV